MIRKFGKYVVTMRDEPKYSRNSTDNPSSYGHEYCRKNKYRHSCAHGITVWENERLLSSAVLLGVGGATGTHEYSLAFDGSNIYVAVGDGLYSLTLPNLELQWCQRADFATCFGVFWLQEKGCILTWGEVEIGAYSIQGEALWNSSGPDIFTEGIEIQKNFARVTDFNGDIYEVDLASGELSIASI